MDFIKESNRIFNCDADGKLLAEVTFPEISTGTVDINHTFVDDSLRGQGIASTIMREAMDEIKKTNRKATLSCSYAIKWLEKNPEYHDIIAD